MSIILLGFSPLSSRIKGFDVKLHPLSSIIVGNFYEFQLGSRCPRMAKGIPKAGQRAPKGTPKGTTGAQRESKGSPKSQKEPQVGPGGAKGGPKTPKGSQRERYISKNSRSTAQADVMLISPVDHWAHEKEEEEEELPPEAWLRTN